MIYNLRHFAVMTCILASFRACPVRSSKAGDQAAPEKGRPKYQPPHRRREFNGDKPDQGHGPPTSGPWNNNRARPTHGRAPWGHRRNSERPRDPQRSTESSYHGANTWWHRRNDGANSGPSQRTTYAGGQERTPPRTEQPNITTHWGLQPAANPKRFHFGRPMKQKNNSQPGSARPEKAYTFTPGKTELQERRLNEFILYRQKYKYTKRSSPLRNDHIRDIFQECVLAHKRKFGVGIDKYWKSNQVVAKRDCLQFSTMTKKKILTLLKSIRGFENWTLEKSDRRSWAGVSALISKHSGWNDRSQSRESESGQSELAEQKLAQIKHEKTQLENFSFFELTRNEIVSATPGEHESEDEKELVLYLEPAQPLCLSAEESEWEEEKHPGYEDEREGMIRVKIIQNEEFLQYAEFCGKRKKLGNFCRDILQQSAVAANHTLQEGERRCRTTGSKTNTTALFSSKLLLKKGLFEGISDLFNVRKTPFANTGFYKTKEEISAALDSALETVDTNTKTIVLFFEITLWRPDPMCRALTLSFDDDSWRQEKFLKFNEYLETHDLPKVTRESFLKECLKINEKQRAMPRGSFQIKSAQIAADNLSITFGSRNALLKALQEVTGFKQWALQTTSSALDGYGCINTLIKKSFRRGKVQELHPYERETLQKIMFFKLSYM